MIRKILIALGLVIASFLVYVAVKPAYFEVSREITINAPASRVFPYTNNVKLANSWNPWLKMDPNAKIELSGPEEGVGGKTSWIGGKDLGVGSATVFESVVNERVGVRLEYTKPFVMTQDAFYLLKSNGEQTVLTWKVQGHNTFLSRLMCTFMNMDKMVGDTFLKGLSELKTRVESETLQK